MAIRRVDDVHVSPCERTRGRRERGLRERALVQVCVMAVGMVVLRARYDERCGGEQQEGRADHDGAGRRLAKLEQATLINDTGRTDSARETNVVLEILIPYGAQIDKCGPCGPLPSVRVW